MQQHRQDERRAGWRSAERSASRRDNVRAHRVRVVEWAACLLAVVAVVFGWASLQAQTAARDRGSATHPGGPLPEFRELYVPADQLETVLGPEAHYVLVQRAEFRRLLEAVRRRAADAPPLRAGLVLTEAEYVGRVVDRQLLLTGRLTFRQTQDGWALVPLRFDQAVLEEATVDGRPACLLSAATGNGPQPTGRSRRGSSPAEPRGERASERQSTHSGRRSASSGEQPSPSAARSAQSPERRRPVELHPYVVHLAHKGAGRFEVQVRLTVPLRPVGSDRLASFSLPSVPAGQLRLTVPAGLSLRLGGHRPPRPAPLDQPAEYTLELGNRDRVSFVLTPRREQEFEQRLVFAWVEQQLNVDVGQVQWSADVTVQVFGKPLQQVTVELPAGLEVVAVEGEQLASWGQAAANEQQRLTLVLRQPVGDVWHVTLRGLLAVSRGDVWRVPVVRVVEAAAAAGRVAVQYPERLRLSLQQSVCSRQQPSVPLRTGSSLRSGRWSRERPRPGEPSSQPEADNGLRRLVFETWDDFQLAFVTRPKAEEVHASVSTLLVVHADRTGLQLVTQVSFQPVFGRLFDLDVELPADWTVLEVTADGQPVPWTSVPTVAGQNRLRLTFDKPVEAGQETRLELKAELVPEGWPPESEPVEVALPEVRLPQTSVVEGALAVQADEELDVVPLELVGLDTAPVEVPGSRLAYAYQDTRFSGKLRVVRRRTALSANTVLLARLERQRLWAHWQANLEVKGGGAAGLRVSVPESVSQDLRFRLLGTAVRLAEQRAEPARDSRRVWYLRFDRRLTGSATLVVDLVQPRGSGAERAETSAAERVPEVLLPDADWVSGFVALEAAADQRLSVRAVDASGRPLSTADPVDVPTLQAYQPEERLVAVFRHSGRYRVELQEKRFAPTPLPVAVCNRLKLTSVVDRSGRWLHSAVFAFRTSGVQTLVVQLPPGTRLSAALLDGRPVLVERLVGHSFGVPAPTGDSADRDHLLVVFYAGQCEPLRTWGELRQPPPSLLARRSDGSTEAVSAVQTEWEVCAPPELDWLASRGPWTPEKPLQPDSLLQAVRQSVQPPTLDGLLLNLLALAALSLGLAVVAAVRRGAGRRLAVGCFVLVLGFVLVLLLLPAAQQSRQAARQAQLRHELRQLELAEEETHILPSVPLAPAGRVPPEKGEEAAEALEADQLVEATEAGKKQKAEFAAERQQAVAQQEPEQAAREPAKPSRPLAEQQPEQAVGQPGAAGAKPSEGRELAQARRQTQLRPRQQAAATAEKLRPAGAGRLSLSVELEVPSDYRRCRFTYLGTSPDGPVVLALSYRSRDAAAALRWAAALLTALLLWWRRRAQAGRRWRWAVVLFGLLVGAAPVVPVLWQPALEGAAGGVVLGALLWAVRTAVGWAERVWFRAERRLAATTGAGSQTPVRTGPSTGQTDSASPVAGGGATAVLLAVAVAAGAAATVDRCRAAAPDNAPHPAARQRPPKRVFRPGTTVSPQKLQELRRWFAERHPEAARAAERRGRWTQGGRVPADPSVADATDTPHPSRGGPQDRSSRQQPLPHRQHPRPVAQAARPHQQPADSTLPNRTDTTEPDKAKPVDLVVPYDPQQDPLSGRDVLVPLDVFLRLWNRAHPERSFARPPTPPGTVAAAYLFVEVEGRRPSGSTPGPSKPATGGGSSAAKTSAPGTSAPDTSAPDTSDASSTSTGSTAAGSTKLPAGGALVTARFVLYGFRKRAVSVPLPLRPVALVDARLDGQPVGLRVQEGQPKRLSVVVPSAGPHVLELRFRLPVQWQGAVGELVVPLVSPPAGRLTLALPAETVPPSGVWLKVNGWLQSPRGAAERPGRFDVALGGLSDVRLRWGPRRPETERPAVVEATSSVTVEVRSAGIFVSSRHRLRVLQGRLERVEFALPPAFRVREVFGPDVAEWHVVARPFGGPAGAARTDRPSPAFWRWPRLVVRFLRAVPAKALVFCELYCDWPTYEHSGGLTAPLLRPLGVASEKGQLLVAAADGFALPVSSAPGFARLSLDQFEPIDAVRVDRPRRRSVPGTDELARASSSASVFAPEPVTPRRAFRFSLRPDQPVLLLLHAVRREPAALSSADHVVQVERRKVHVRSRLRWTLTDAARSVLQVKVPSDFLTLELTGAGVADWYESQASEEGWKTLTVELTKSFTGGLQVELTGYWRKSPDAASVKLRVPVPVGVDSHWARLAVWVDPSYSAALAESQPWEPVPTSKLPVWLRPSDRLPQLALTARGTPDPPTLHLQRKKPRRTAACVTVVTVTDSFVDYSLVLKWNVQGASTDRFRFEGPSWLKERLQFRGGAVRLVRTRPTGRRRTEWTLLAERPVEGPFVAVAQATFAASDQNQLAAPDVRFPKADQPDGVELQRRFVVLVNLSSSRLERRPADGLELVEVKELPVTLTELQARQATECLQLVGEAAPPVWSLQRFARRAAVPASVNLAELKTVVAADGSWRLLAQYTCKNRSRQFLPVVLPKDTQLVSARVDGQPVKPVRLEGADPPVCLIALPKSSDASLSFRVEVVLAGRLTSRVFSGRPVWTPKPLRLPAPRILSLDENPDLGVPVARTVWTVYLPESLRAWLVEQPRASNVFRATREARVLARQLALTREALELLDVATGRYSLKTKAVARQQAAKVYERVRRTREALLEAAGSEESQKLVELQEKLLERLSKLGRQEQQDKAASNLMLGDVQTQAVELRSQAEQLYAQNALAAPARKKYLPSVKSGRVGKERRGAVAGRKKLDDRLARQAQSFNQLAELGTRLNAARARALPQAAEEKRPQTAGAARTGAQPTPTGESLGRRAAGTLALTVTLPEKGRELVFVKAGGGPQLTLRVLPNESLQRAFRWGWLVLCLAVTATVVTCVSSTNQAWKRRKRRVGQGLLVLGAVWLLAVQPPTSLWGAVALSVGAWVASGKTSTSEPGAESSEPRSGRSEPEASSKRED